MLFPRLHRGDNPDRLFRPIGTERKIRIGELNNKTKITTAEAIEIKKRLELKHKVIDIANELKISKYLIYDIKRKKTWVWLDKEIPR